MSHLYGGIRQLGFVVSDVDETARYWSKKLGVGPFFFFRHVSFDNFRLHENAAISPTVTLAVAYSGPMQIELIEQHDDKPSIYLEFLQSGRSGLQHVSSWCSSRDEYDGLHDRARARGDRVLQEASIYGIRFAYFDTGSDPGNLPFEVSEGLLPTLDPMRHMMQEAALNWDGAEPLRDVRL